MAIETATHVVYDTETDRLRDVLRKEDERLHEIEAALIAERDQLNKRLADIGEARTATKMALERLSADKPASSATYFDTPDRYSGGTSR